MKKAVILGLICANAVLLVALALQSEPPRAHAQAFRGAADYLAVTGKVARDYDALYVIDLAKRRMLTFTVDKTSKKMIPQGPRRFKADFPAPESRD